MIPETPGETYVDELIEKYNDMLREDLDIFQPAVAVNVDEEAFIRDALRSLEQHIRLEFASARALAEETEGGA